MNIITLFHLTNNHFIHHFIHADGKELPTAAAQKLLMHGCWQQHVRSGSGQGGQKTKVVKAIEAAVGGGVSSVYVVYATLLKEDKWKDVLLELIAQQEERKKKGGQATKLVSHLHFVHCLQLFISLQALSFLM